MKKQSYQVFINTTSAQCALTIISIDSNSSNRSSNKQRSNIERLIRFIINLTKATEVPPRRWHQRLRQYPAYYGRLINRRIMRRIRVRQVIYGQQRPQWSGIIRIGDRRRRYVQRRTLVNRLLPLLPRPLPPRRRSVLPAAFLLVAFPVYTRARYTGIMPLRYTPFKRLVFTKRLVIMRFCRRVRCLPAAWTRSRPTLLPTFIYSPNPATKLCALSSLLYDLSSILVKAHTGWSNSA